MSGERGGNFAMSSFVMSFRFPVPMVMVVDRGSVLVDIDVRVGWLFR